MLACLLLLFVSVGPPMRPLTLEQAITQLGTVDDVSIAVVDGRDDESRAVRKWLARPRRGHFWSEYAHLEYVYGVSLEWTGQNQFSTREGPAVVEVTRQTAQLPAARVQQRYRLVMRPNRSGEAEVRLEFLPGEQRVIAARWIPKAGAPGDPETALVHWGSVSLGTIPTRLADLVTGHVEVTTAKRSTTIDLDLSPGSEVAFPVDHPVRRAVLNSFRVDRATSSRSTSAPSSDRYALELALEGPFCEKSSCWLWDCRLIDRFERKLPAAILETSLPVGTGAQSFRVVVPAPEFQAPLVRFQAELPIDLEVQTLEIEQMRVIRNDGA